MVTRAALLVDFDNVYISLKGASGKAAHNFARNPGAWLDWLEQRLYASDVVEDHAILVKRCYINPGPFQDFRQNFTYSGFQTIDCPSLTGQGKNSADILMALDVIDLLNHPTHFDEFIILSGDADFTPVLLRLREHDRKTAVMANAATSGALKSAATHVIEIDDFIEQALGAPAPVAAAAGNGGPAPVAAERLDTVDKELALCADLIVERARRTGALPVAEMPSAILSGYPAFKDSRWLGFDAASALARAIAAADRRLTLVGEGMNRVFALSEDAMDAAPAIDADERTRLSGEIAEFVAQLVADSEKPIHGSSIGVDVIERFGRAAKDDDWLGHGTLSNLVAAEAPEGLAVATRPGGAYFYDPDRHADSLPPEVSAGANLAHVSEEMHAFIDRLGAVGWPRLSPMQHGLIVLTAAQAIANGETERNPLSATMRTEIEEQVERGVIEAQHLVTRGPINYILTGMMMNGAEFGENCSTEAELRDKLRETIVNFQTSKLGEPSEEERALIEELICADVADDFDAAPGPGEDDEAPPEAAE